MPNQSGSSIFLAVGSTIIGEKELAKLRADSKELAEMQEAMKMVDCVPKEKAAPVFSQDFAFNDGETL